MTFDIGFNKAPITIGILRVLAALYILIKNMLWSNSFISLAGFICCVKSNSVSLKGFLDMILLKL